MLQSPEPLAIVGALSLGLLANAHCFAMCGGISAALGAASGGNNSLSMALAYNIGRILCYAMLGAIAGSVIGVLQSFLPILGPVLRAVAGLLVIAMGLYLGGWWLGLTRIEKIGGHAWRRLQPLTKNLLPPRNTGAAMALGALWGLLPCGLIYSTLGWAATSADPWRGAILMSSFGLGTLPVLLLAALGGQRVMKILREPLLRKTAGVLLIGFGALTIAAPLQHAVGHHGGEHAGHQM
jgi:sulfite exporter TauE/SafE